MCACVYVYVRVCVCMCVCVCVYSQHLHASSPVPLRASPHLAHTTSVEPPPTTPTRASPPPIFPPQTDQAYVVRADMPGVSKEDVKITMVRALPPPPSYSHCSTLRSMLRMISQASCGLVLHPHHALPLVHQDPPLSI
jgi:hypothetical protein